MMFIYTVHSIASPCTSLLSTLYTFTPTLSSLQLVLADRVDHFNHSYKGCSAVNPGSFSSDFSFIVYQPATRDIQFSRVP